MAGRQHIIKRLLIGASKPNYSISCLLAVPQVPAKQILLKTWCRSQAPGAGRCRVARALEAGRAPLSVRGRREKTFVGAASVFRRSDRWAGM